MATFLGNLGSISWGSSSGFIYTLMSTYSGPATFDISCTAPTLDSTRFSSAAGGATHRRVSKGLRQVQGKIKLYLPTPAIGSSGLVSLGTYGGFAREYNLSIKAESFDSTRFNGTAPEWVSRTPGLLSWSGSMSGPMESGTALPVAGGDSEPLAATFTITSTKSVSGNVYVTNVSHTTDPAKLTEFKLDFEGDSYLATSGAGTHLWAADSAPPPYSITTPETGKTLTLTSYTTNHVYAGEAHWTSIDLSVGVDKLIELTVNFVGSGAWTGFTGS